MTPQHSGARYLCPVADPTMTATASPRGRRRLRRHLIIAIGVAAGVALLAALFHGPPREQFSLATAYLALGLLAVTLSLGPMNVLRGRPNPVSFDLRRDFGIWSALVGLLHTGLGLTVHFTGRMQLYFLAPDDGRSLFGLRADPFGAANYTGLIAALLLLLLAAISNDLSLRNLGTRRWRSVQRWAYLVLVLTMLHAALYQVLEKQRMVLVGLFVVMAVAIVGVQFAGYRRVRGG